MSLRDGLENALLCSLSVNPMFHQKGRPSELAVDVGCGSGQGTLLLAKHFASVVGTDVSPAQLELAMEHNKEPNVTYRYVLAPKKILILLLLFIHLVRRFDKDDNVAWC